MCLSSQLFKFTTLVVLLHKTYGIGWENVVKVPMGENVTLECLSSDTNHSFYCWYINDQNIVIGPGNYYDKGKFRYAVLSGNLIVKSVSKNEEGIYNCVARGVREDDVKVRSIRMVVQSDWEEVLVEDPNVNLFRVVIVLTTLVIIGAVSYAGYRIWKNRHRHASYLAASDEDDDSGEELFRAPGTSNSSTSIIKNNSTESFTGISTDFRSILDRASDS